MTSKKGDISMNYIVIAAIALIVLIVIVLAFTGKLQMIFKSQTETVKEATDQQLEVWRSQCKLYCSLGQKDNFCKHVFKGPEDVKGEYYTYACNILKSNIDGTQMVKDYPQNLGLTSLNVECETITSCT